MIVHDDEAFESSALNANCTKTSFSTIEEAIAWAHRELANHGIDSPEIDAMYLLSKAIGKDRTYFFLYPKEKIEKIKCELFTSYIKRRVNREPVAYITGEKEFWSIPFTVTTDTLIPRPDTEILVQQVLEYIKRKNLEQNDIVRILDVGTGSGNIPVSLASETGSSVQIFSVDISGEALKVARKNIISSGYSKRVNLIHGNFLEPFQRNRRTNKGFDVILSNPPYIAPNQMESLMAEVKDHEPHIALFSSTDDGLNSFRAIIEKAIDLLNHDGALFFEVGFGQADHVAALIREKSVFNNIKIIKDYSGINRVVGCEKK